MIVVEDCQPDRLVSLAPGLHRLYRRCFAEPPWSESDEAMDGFPARLAVDMDRPGAGGVVAWDGARLVGATYGRAAPAVLPDDDFHRALTAGVPADVWPDLVAPAVRVIELMVDPDDRGRGVGRDLLARYVAGYPAAWLLTHPRAPARGLYEAARFRPRGDFISHRGDPRVLYTRAGLTARVAK